MGKFGFSLGRGATRAVIEGRLSGSTRRRLSDDIEALIGKACSSGHFHIAERLLETLRDLLATEKSLFPQRRRSPEGVIEALAGEIKAARERRSAA